MQIQVINGSKLQKSGFLTSKARLAFIKLWQAFIKVSIFHYFNSKYYIYIKTMAS